MLAFPAGKGRARPEAGRQVEQAKALRRLRFRQPRGGACQAGSHASASCIEGTSDASAHPAGETFDARTAGRSMESDRSFEIRRSNRLPFMEIGEDELTMNRSIAMLIAFALSLRFYSSRGSSVLRDCAGHSCFLDHEICLVRFYDELDRWKLVAWHDEESVTHRPNVFVLGTA